MLAPSADYGNGEVTEMPRRYLSPSLSRDELFAEIATENPSAALFYVMALPHSADDCTLPTANPSELRMLVCPGIEGITRVAVAEWIALLTTRRNADGHTLLEYDASGNLRYPPESFYRHQAYIKGDRRQPTEPAKNDDTVRNTTESAFYAGTVRNTPEPAKNNLTRDVRESSFSFTSSFPFTSSFTDSRPSGDGAEAVHPSPVLEVPLVATSFHEVLVDLRGYRPTEAFYRKVAEKYAHLDLEEEALKARDWLADHRKRNCSTAFMLNWLKRASENAAILPITSAEHRIRAPGRASKPNRFQLMDAWLEVMQGAHTNQPPPDDPGAIAGLLAAHAN